MRMSFLSCMTGGSSPLARGLHQGHLSGRPGPGIIPARAGFTLSCFLIRCTGRDHPRSRGVYWERNASIAACTGSSPLARGLRGSRSGRGRRPRIIPARAGFTLSCFLIRCTGRDHPRSRGVYWERNASIAACTGSSPLARGLRGSRSGRGRRPRIIPARAGFTTRMILCPIHARDHPRSRGVYTKFLTIESDEVGSSPLARGLR